MNPTEWNTNEKEALEIVLGYLNFSSGDPAPKFLMGLNTICAGLDARKEEGDSTPAWRRLAAALWDYLKWVQPTSDVFAQDTQVRQALLFAFLYFFPQYRVWHKDLLFHQKDDVLFNAFSIGQAFYAILQEKAFEAIPADAAEIASSAEFLKTSDEEAPAREITPEIQDAIDRTINRYDDFIGYRPIPVLHSRQKMQPYRHEWLHAIPLYIKGVGVVHGEFTQLVTDALEFLKITDESLLNRAMFDMDHLEELCFDPRALDFNHPVNRRLNYHFGSWDPLHITNKGYYDRFILIESTIRSIFSRGQNVQNEENGIPKEELQKEAAAVLAGTLLMGGAVCGWGPSARTSNDTFEVLLPKIAKIRDDFYQQLLEKIPESHAKRLREEAEILHQPFASARQYFNRKLSKQRAEQYQNVQLGRLYAWMGYEDASDEMIARVNVPSTRMRCKIDCLMTKGHLDIDFDRIQEAISKLYKIEEILHEGIECGAFIDPWYILGFDGQFPLSLSVEDSTQDQRVDELISLMSTIFSLYSRILKETAAKGLKKERTELMFRMEKLTQWWDQFGTLELSEINSISGAETYESIQIVLKALDAWYEGGTAAGDIAFWRPRVADFTSPKAYTLLIEALLDQKDPVAAMALLINWLSQSELIKLDDGDYSFHPLTLRWMEDLWYPPTKEQRLLCRRGATLTDNWKLAKRFIELVEANADIYGTIPTLDLDSSDKKSSSKKSPRKPGRPKDEDFETGFDSPDEEGDGNDKLFNAAWENVVYHDSTDDGIDDSMMEGESLKRSMEDFPLTSEMERISDRVLFIITQARLWKMAAVFSIPFADEHEDRSETLQNWIEQATEHRKRLESLISDVKMFEVEKPDFSRSIATMEYEKQLGTKFLLLDRLVSTASELEDAQRLMRIADVKNRISQIDTWENATRSVMQALICGEPQTVKKIWHKTTKLLTKEPILYEPIERGGDPIRMIQIKSILTVIQRLLTNLPRQGLLAETYDIFLTVQEMERLHPIAGRAITRYDALFELGSKGILRSILISGAKPGRKKWDLETLISLLDQMMEILLENWISHSHGIRISSLDPYQDHREWIQLKTFIQTYGEDLFSPIQMNYSNLQAIHHEGVSAWLASLREIMELSENSWFPEGKEIQGKKLLEDLKDQKIFPIRAERMLETIVETLLERYDQFIDYNTTTTQSDNGANLYILFDFLRLLGQYDRLSWDLQPFVNAHNVIVRENNYEVADSWLESIQSRSARQAKQFIRSYKKLCIKYGLTVKTVGDRIDERFVKPMAINKLCALLEPSIQEARKGGETPSFNRFLELVKEFTADAIGTGYEPPDWLEEIEDEINRYRNRSEEDDEMLDLKDFIPSIPLRKTDILRIIHELNPNLKPGQVNDDAPEKFGEVTKKLSLVKLVDTLNDPDVTIEEVKDFLLKQFKNEAFVGIDLGNEPQAKDDSEDIQEDHPGEDEDSEDDALFRKLFE
ncbi:MAG: hypothetical protein IJQ31_10985 [Thermoguttaceae bacterium]|nr:hypothetical protein [Thermoguttaceae bacterium]